MSFVPSWKLDRLITLERKAVSRSSATGAEVVTWPAVTQLWASKEESAGFGDEALRGPVEVAGATSRIRTRYRADVTAADRLNLGGGQIRQIVGVAELGRREGLELACKEWSHE